MDSPLIHDRGRGPELRDTRITVYELLTYFRDPTATEEYVCRLYDLTPEQVAALRAYAFNHYEAVMAHDRKVEERIAAETAAQDTPEFRAQREATRADMRLFKAWLTERAAVGLPPPASWDDKRAAFQSWKDARAVAGVPPPPDLPPIRSEVADAPGPTFREWLAAQHANGLPGGGH